MKVSDASILSRIVSKWECIKKRISLVDKRLREFHVSSYDLLSLVFCFHFMSIQLTSWVFYLTGRYITFYHAILGVYGFTVLTMLVKRYRLDGFDRRIVFTMAYLLVVPTALGSLDILESVRDFKNIVAPFALYFFLRLVLASIKEVYGFLRLVVYAGLLATVYAGLEVANRFLNLCPILWVAPQSFIQKYRPGYSAYMNRYISFGSKHDILRPLGVFLDIYSQAFLMIAAFFIVLIFGPKLFKCRHTYRVIGIVLLIGVVFSTAKTYMLILAGVSFALFVFELRTGIGRNTENRHLRRSLAFSGVMLVVIMFLSYAIFSPVIERLLGMFVMGSAANIAVRNYYIHQVIATLPLDNPLAILLGYGYDFPEELIMGGEMHHIGAHLTRMGLVGVVLYWGVFVKGLCESWQRIKKLGVERREGSLLLLGGLLCVAYMLTLVHYNPLLASNNFIPAFVLFIGSLAYRQNRGLPAECCS